MDRCLSGLFVKSSESLTLIRIEICGGIASGKTTCASLLSQIGFSPIYENFQSNPFWEDFYTESDKYNFETEICFMLQHYHQIKKLKTEDKNIVCDYSFLLDRAYGEIGLKGSQLNTFVKVCTEITQELPPPALIIHLQCDAETELDRIRKRGRDVEAYIDQKFLDSLNKAVEREVKKISHQVKVVTIDSGRKDFAHDESIRKEMLQLVAASLV
jgi:deoxyadenosine/deoxycytidine kinase